MNLIFLSTPDHARKKIIDLISRALRTYRVCRRAFFCLLICYNVNMNRKCLTLVELMIVCVVIGVMATIAVPSFRKAKERTRDTEVKASLRQILDHVKNSHLAEDCFIGLACSDTAADPRNCQNLLDFDLFGDGAWRYTIDASVDGSLLSRIFARRHGGLSAYDGREWEILYPSGEYICTPSGKCLSGD